MKLSNHVESAIHRETDNQKMVSGEKDRAYQEEESNLGRPSRGLGRAC